MNGYKNLKKLSPLKLHELKLKYHSYSAGTIAILDGVIERMFDILPHNTYVTITSDHGELFGEDGYFFHSSRLSDVQSRTPAIMVGPGVPSLALAGPTTHMDLAPTIFHVLAGKTVPVAGAYGRDLLVPEAESAPLLLVDFHLEELLLVTAKGRLQLHVSADRARLGSRGFLDEQARFVPLAPVRQSEAAWWANAVDRELDRLSR